MTDYDKRLDALEAKRNGLTDADKAELALIHSQLLRDARESNKRAGELLAQMMTNIEKIKNF